MNLLRREGEELRTRSKMAESRDSVLDKALAESGAQSGQDALVVALHASLLSEGFVCTALGDEVWWAIIGDIQLST